MKEATRSEAIAWCKSNGCDFETAVFTPPEGWAWAQNDGKGLVLQPIFTITDQGSEITKTHVNESVYCPVCGRYIDPSNVEEVRDGEHDGFLFVHDDVIHTEDDLEALRRGLQ